MSNLFNITTPYADIKARVERAKQQVEDDKRALLNALGVATLQQNQLDYRKLSRGGTASDGRKWKALSPKTIRQKLKRGLGNKTQQNRIKRAQKTQAMIEKHRSKFGNITSDMEASLRRTSRTISEATGMMGTTSIGIDTGLQFASGSPGYHTPGGGNIFEISQNRVKVGYGRRYSKYFDRVRALMPVKLPQSWRKILDRIVARWLSDKTAGIGS